MCRTLQREPVAEHSAEGCNTADGHCDEEDGFRSGHYSLRVHQAAQLQAYLRTGNPIYSSPRPPPALVAARTNPSVHVQVPYEATEDYRHQSYVHSRQEYDEVRCRRPR